jgi:hypothetical protein
MTDSAESIAEPLPVGSGAVRVPAQYAGMSYHRAPPPAEVECALTRNWDGAAVAGHIAPGAERYEWAALDAFARAAAGQRIIFTLGFAPDHLYRRAPRGNWPYPTCPRGNLVPDDLAGWARLVTAIADRFRVRHGRTGILWELWNEVDVPAMFSDDMARLGPYTRLTAQAIRAVDPQAIILSPSYVQDDPNLANGSEFVLWANAPDGAGGAAKHWVQGLAYHSYEGSGFRPENLVRHWQNLQSGAALAGLSLPTYITESGYLSADPTQARDVGRDLLLHAALGAQCYLGYSYDNGNSGLAGITGEWNRLVRTVAGAVIDECHIVHGQVHATLGGRRIIL